MSTFSVKANDIDMESVLSSIKEKIDKKRGGLYTEEEVREITEMKLEAIPDGSQFSSGGACNPTLTIVSLAIRGHKRVSM